MSLTRRGEWVRVQAELSLPSSNHGYQRIHKHKSPVPFPTLPLLSKILMQYVFLDFRELMITVTGVIIARFVAMITVVTVRTTVNDVTVTIETDARSETDRLVTNMTDPLNVTPSRGSQAADLQMTESDDDAQMMKSANVDQTMRSANVALMMRRGEDVHLDPMTDVGRQMTGTDPDALHPGPRMRSEGPRRDGGMRRTNGGG